MSYQKKTWKDRLVEFATRRLLTDEQTSATQLVTVTRSEGDVYQEGDAFSATNMNDLENRIGDQFDITPESFAGTVQDAEQNTYTATQLGGVAYDATNEQLLLKLGGADTVIPFSGGKYGYFIHGYADVDATYSAASISEVDGEVITQSSNVMTLHKDGVILVSGGSGYISRAYLQYVLNGSAVTILQKSADIQGDSFTTKITVHKNDTLYFRAHTTRSGGAQSGDRCAMCTFAGAYIS